MEYFCLHALHDDFSGAFDGDGEGWVWAPGSISRSLASSFVERMQRLAQDFSQQHLADQRLAEKERAGYTVRLAMRSWEHEAFDKLRR